MKQFDSIDDNIKKDWILLLQNSNSLGITNEQIKLIINSKIKNKKISHG